MDDGDRWISISDLMSGLMMVFLFVSIALLTREQGKNKTIKEKVQKTKELSEKMNAVLDKEFNKDFLRWGAKRLRDGTIRFTSPKIMFDSNSSRIKKRFRNILTDFCPRFVNMLKKYYDPSEIHEIKISGHSSSGFQAEREKERHFQNAKLSVARAWNVHNFCYDSIYSPQLKKYFSERAVTIGSNDVHRVKNPNGDEIRHLSRRVEFKAKLKSLSNLEEEFINAK